MEKGDAGPNPIVHVPMHSISTKLTAMHYVRLGNLSADKNRNYHYTTQCTACYNTKLQTRFSSTSEYNK